MKTFLKKVWTNFKLDWKLQEDNHDGMIIILFGSGFLIDVVNLIYPLKHHAFMVFLCLLPVMFLLYYGYLIKLPKE